VSVFWGVRAAAIATSLIGQTLPKAGSGAASFMAQLLDWRTLSGLSLYGGAATLYIAALRRIPMSVALTCTAVSYIAVALIGHYPFNETLTPLHVGAIGLIACGVVMLAFA
jgi:small multidrug resistance pump